MSASDSHESKFKSSYSSALELRSLGEYAKALEKFSKAIELSSHLDNQNDERICDSYLGAARCHYRLGNTSEAEEKYKLALSLSEDQQKDEPLQASILWEIAVLLTDQKRFKEAAQFFRHSIIITSKHSGPNDRFIADCLWGLSKCFCALGQLDTAEDAIRNALNIYESTDGDTYGPVITNRKNLVNILLEKNKYKEAFEEIERLRQSKYAADLNKDLCQLYFKFAWTAQRNSDYKFADKALKKALRLTSNASGANSLEMTLTRLAVAHNKNCLGEYSTAERLLKQSLKVLKKEDQEVFKYDVAGSLFELGLCYMKQNKIKDSIKVLEDLLLIHEDDPLFSPELFADTLHNLAYCHELDCNLKRAKELNNRAIFVKEQVYGGMHEEVAQSLFQLSSCLRKLDDLMEADFAQVRASEITEALFTSS